MSRELRHETRERRRERETLDRKKEELTMDIRAVAGSPEGLHLLRWLLEHGNILQDDYQPGAAGAYTAGKKAAALELAARLRQALPRDVFVSVVLPEAPENGMPDVAEGGTFPEDELPW